MSKSIQEIFNRIQEKKKEVSIVRRKYKEELSTSVEYGKIVDDIQRLQEKKKKYEAATKQIAGGQFARVDELALAIRQDNQLLSDIALTSIMKGESVDVKDANSTYEPVFTVKFKRIK